MNEQGVYNPTVTTDQAMNFRYVAWGVAALIFLIVIAKSR